MTKITILNEDDLEVIIDIEMKDLLTLMQSLTKGTRIIIPVGYFSSENSASIKIE